MNIQRSEKLKTILYLALAEIYKEHNGVAKKIKMQLKGMEENGYRAICLAYGEKGYSLFENGKETIISNYKNYRPKRFFFFSVARKYIEKHSIDICYIRFPYFDYCVWTLLRMLKDKKIRVIMEIPTYPIKRYKFNRKEWKFWARDQIEKLFIPSLKRYIDKIVYIGNKVEKIFGIKAVRISNGCSIEEYKLIQNQREDDTIRIIGIGSMFYHQGFDRLIKGIALYKNEKKDIKVEAYLIGEGEALAELKKVAYELKVNEYVKFYNWMEGQELDNIFNKCDIGCASLGLYSVGITEASTLKAKEYLSRGLPFICAYQEIGLPSDCIYAIHVPEDDSPIDIEYVINQYLKNKVLYKPEEIREFAENTFSWRNIMKKALLR